MTWRPSWPRWATLRTSRRALIKSTHEQSRPPPNTREGVLHIVYAPPPRILPTHLQNPTAVPTTLYSLQAIEGLLNIAGELGRNDALFKDRTYALRTFEKCAPGELIVTWFVERHHARDR